MALHRLTALALTGVLALGASGCGGDTPDPSPSTSSAAASPTPTSSGPAAPVLPDAATRRTETGARAFVEYWFQAVTYAVRTGDLHSVEQIAAPECKGCNNLIKMVGDIYRADLHLGGGGWTIRGVAHDSRVVMPYQRFAVTMVQPRMRVLDTHEKLIKQDKAQRGVMLVTALWRSGRWRLYESVLVR